MGGFAELRFSCRDTAGHAVVDLAFTSEGSSSEELDESARFRIPISAAGVDQFVKRLQSLTVESEFSAYLPWEP
jgi:hypothetical protein